MANILIDPVIVMSPSDNASKEDVEAWLINLDLWLTEALSSPFTWLYAKKATEELLYNGLFPTPEILFRWQRKYRLNTNIALIKEHGILPWLDIWELRPGLPWQKGLGEQLKQIKSAAVFVGKRGIGPWQQQEVGALLNEFVKRGYPVIPVLLPDAAKKPKSPIFLEGMTWVDFRLQDPDPLQQLLWGITGKRDNERYRD